MTMPMDFVTAQDQDDLERADKLRAEGKALRTRVLIRIRNRKWRANRSKA